MREIRYPEVAHIYIEFKLNILVNFVKIGAASHFSLFFCPSRLYLLQQ